MKQSKIILTVAAALVALVAVSGVVLYSHAQDEGEATDPTRPFMMGKFPNLTDEQKAEMEAKREEFMAEREAARQKMSAAIGEGYGAWAQAVREARGDNDPILGQITADNFNRFTEGHEYMEKARDIFSELGIERGMGGMGKGKFGRMGKGGCFGARTGNAVGAGFLSEAQVQ